MKIKNWMRGKTLCFFACIGSLHLCDAIEYLINFGVYIASAPLSLPCNVVFVFDGDALGLFRRLDDVS